MLDIARSLVPPVGSICHLTPEVLHVQAAHAAEQGIPLVEANHHEPESVLWHLFNNAYRQAAFNACEVV